MDSGIEIADLAADRNIQVVERDALNRADAAFPPLYRRPKLFGPRANAETTPFR